MNTFHYSFSRPQSLPVEEIDGLVNTISEGLQRTDGVYRTNSPESQAGFRRTVLHNAREW